MHVGVVRSLFAGLAQLALVVLPISTNAAPPQGTTISNEARELLEATTTRTGPGVVVLITRGDSVLFRGARGAANIELGVALSSNHVFHIASITKMFTAAMIMKLAEMGKLSLDDPLARFLPDFPGAEGMTIRQLLSHTAGISDSTAPKDMQPGFSRRDVDMATLVGEIAKRPRAFAPGVDQAYSNAGYVLLGAVIEKITGEPWHAAIKEQLLDPLGLKHTGYGLASSVISGRIAGYTTDTPDHSVRNAPYISMTIPASAGGLVSTVDDLRSWMRALTSGRVVSDASYRQMITPVIPPGVTPSHPYGLGMYAWKVRSETMIGHIGQINGFAAVLAYLPSRDIIIVALSNDDNFDAQNFGRRLAAIALSRPYPIVVGVPIATDDLKAFSGAYQEGPAVRLLLSKDGKLYTRRGSGNIVPLQMTADGQLHFVPDELSYFVPVRDSAGSVVRLDNYEHGEGPPRPLPRIPTVDQGQR